VHGDSESPRESTVMVCDHVVSLPQGDGERDYYSWMTAVRTTWTTAASVITERINMQSSGHIISDAQAARITVLSSCLRASPAVSLLVIS
jgi:hypothetical protein